jgi:AmmeMemoRadiSam system protein B
MSGNFDCFNRLKFQKTGEGRIRSSYAAGMFYEKSPDLLRKQIEECFLKGPGVLPGDTTGKRIIACGIVSNSAFAYSGPVSAYFYKALKEDGIPESFIIMATDLTGYLDEKCALYPPGTWRTPIGDALVDNELSKAIQTECSDVRIDTRSLDIDTSIESQLPFLIYMYGPIKFVPLLVNCRNSFEDSIRIGKTISDAIKRTGKDVVIIASSSGDHYETFAATRKRDRKAVEALVKMDLAEFLGSQKTYNLTWNGVEPIFMAVTASKTQNNCECKLLEYSTSYEVMLEAGVPVDDNSVCGYVAFSINKIKEDTDEIKSGMHLEHYKLLRKLGRGGMGIAFLANDSILQRQVVLKIIKPEYSSNPQVIQRFQNEARAQAKLGFHQNIVSIFHISTAKEKNYIAMEYIDGGSLRDLLSIRSKLEVSEALTIFSQICLGLVHSHNFGVIHRDLKPENVLLTKNGVAKIADFGLAKIQGAQSITVPGEIMGTYAYMAPEQIRGEKVDQRADIYAMGILLYEMMVGRVPFSCIDGADILFRQLNEVPKSPRIYNSKIPTKLDNTIMRALKKNPDERFQTVEEMAQSFRLSAL